MIELKTKKRRSDGTLEDKTYNVYTHTEAKKLKISYVNWRDAEQGDWCKTDDHYVLQCLKTGEYRGFKTVVTPAKTFHTGLGKANYWPPAKRPWKVAGGKDDYTVPWPATISEWLDIWLGGDMDMVDAWCEMERRRGTKRTAPRYVMGSIKNALDREPVKEYVVDTLKREFKGQVEKVVADINKELASAFHELNVDAMFLASNLKKFVEDDNVATRDKLSAIKEINKILDTYPHKTTVKAEGNVAHEFLPEELELLNRGEDGV